MENGLSVRDTEVLVRPSSSNTKSPIQNPQPLSADLSKIENVLSSHFGTRIHLLRKSNGSGKITIPYENDNDLNRILELLNQ
jgi:ParB family chromosome partitioning protein